MKFVPAPGSLDFDEVVAVASAPVIAIGDVVELPVTGPKQRFVIRSILHRIDAEGDIETIYGCD